MAAKVAHLAYLESQRRLSEVLREGKACFRSSHIRKSHPVLAITCGFFAAAAARHEQKIAEWASLTVATADYGSPIVNKMAGKSVKIGGLYVQDQAKLFLKVPQVLVKRGKGRIFLPWAHCGPKIVNSQLLASIVIKVNQQPVCFVVDTGSENPELNTKTAKRLGIIAHKGVYGAVTSLVSGRKTPYHLGIVRSLELGGTRFYNVAFSIRRGRFNVIGNDILQQLGNLLFTKRGLVINPREPSNCRQPMAYSYKKSLVRARGPMFKVLINGEPVRVLFDSGMSASLFTNSRKYLAKNASFSGKFLAGDMIGSDTAYRTSATFSLHPSASPTTVDMDYTPTYKSRIHVKAGFGILKYYDVWLDFDNHTACFLPAG